MVIPPPIEAGAAPMNMTVISTIFIPLTFIVGVFGMNFRYMPELEWHYGYPLVMLAMAVITGLMLLWFRKRKWL